MKRTVFFLPMLVILLCLPHTAYADGPFDSGFLWLVNHNNRLDPAYVPPNLAEHKGHQMHPAVLEAYERMTAAMREDGIHGVYIQSAYRSFNRQQFLFRSRVNTLRGQGYDERAAIERTSRSLAFPGASEHQTGLAIDVTLDGRLVQSFGDTEAGRWLADNCHNFGFIIRYPKEKTHITRIVYEPWHLRYVGNPHASFMKEQDLCLEEYIDYLIDNKRYVFWDVNRVYFMVSYGEAYNGSLHREMVDVSADRAGETADFIFTTRQRLPEEL
jgi:D-alanyl-D-alanine carboxypeptidase